MKKLKIAAYLIFALSLIVIFSIDYLVNISKEPPISMAKPYQIIEIADTSIPNRKRKIVHFRSDQALTFESRAETAVKVAIDNANDTDAITAILVIGPPYTINQPAISIATYAKDSLGIDGLTPLNNDTWEAKALPTNKILNPQSGIINQLWYENRDNFLVNGTLDEHALKEFIASRLNIEIYNVNLPVLTLTNYSK